AMAKSAGKTTVFGGTANKGSPSRDAETSRGAQPGCGGGEFGQHEQHEGQQHSARAAGRTRPCPAYLTTARNNTPGRKAAARRSRQAERGHLTPPWGPGGRTPVQPRARSTSATRSAESSQPAENLTKPSGTGSPHCARRSTVLCKPPKLEIGRAHV